MLDKHKKKHICPWWLAYTFDNPLRKLFHKPGVIFKDLVREGMTVIDVGCGMGYFSIGLARIVGPQGRVYGVDLQQKMLDVLIQRASRAQVSEIISTHQCQAHSIVLRIKVDFALAFWVVHETPDPEIFFEELSSLLNKKGKILVVEPLFHVTERRFSETLDIACKVGLKIDGNLPVKFSRAAILSHK